MNGRTLILLVAIALFGLLTAEALIDVGYFGIFEAHLPTWAGRQVLVDLVIACVLACIWIRADATARGRNPWPFIILTLVAGSFGPLAYLLVREIQGERRGIVAAA